MTAEERKTLLAAIDKEMQAQWIRYSSTRDTGQYRAEENAKAKVMVLRWVRALIEETKDDSHEG